MGFLIVIFWIFCACAAAGIANGKHRSVPGWFFLGLLFGPFAWIVAAMDPLDPKPTTDQIIAAYEAEQRSTAGRRLVIDQAAPAPGDRPISLPPGAVRQPRHAPQPPGPKRFDS
jgi:hypothetical protein